VDTSDLCSPDSRRCWSMRELVPPEVASTPAYWLMKRSLENSNIYDSIKWRLGSALQAQESVSQFISTPLDPKQWEVEARQLFATSIARIQYDVWQIATGEDRDKPGHVEVTPDEAKGFLCGLYKFKGADHTNVNLAAFIGFILLAIAIFLLSLDASTDGSAMTSKENESVSSKPLVIGVIINGMLFLVSAIVKGIYIGYLFLGQRLKRRVAGREGRNEAVD